MVLHVFMHDMTWPEDVEYLEIYPQNASYDERALVAARPRDVVCISGRVDPEYIKFLRRYGIGPAAGHVFEFAASAEEGPVPMADRLRRDRLLLDRLLSIVSGRSQVVSGIQGTLRGHVFRSGRPGPGYFPITAAA
jgi:hypothetical protein